MPNLENLSEADIHGAILKAFLPQEIEGHPGVVVTQERREPKSFDVGLIIAKERRLLDQASDRARSCR